MKLTVPATLDLDIDAIAAAVAARLQPPATDDVTPDNPHDPTVDDAVDGAKGGEILPPPVVVPPRDPADQPTIPMGKPVGVTVAGRHLLLDGRKFVMRGGNSVFWSASEYSNEFERYAADPRYGINDNEAGKGWFAAILRGLELVKQKAPGFNTVRLTYQASGQFGFLSSSLARQRKAIEFSIALGLVPIVGFWDLTGDSTLAAKEKLMNAAWFNPGMLAILRDYPSVVINPGNELNFDVGGDFKHPSSPAQAAGFYKNLIRRFRAEGITNTVLLDGARAHGQDPALLMDYGADIVAADPLRRVAFAVHMYAFWTTGKPDTSWKIGQFSVQEWLPKLAALPFPVVLSEYGYNAPGEFTPAGRVGLTTEVANYDTRIIHRLALEHELGTVIWALVGKDNTQYQLIDNLYDDDLSEMGKLWRRDLRL